jgi:hypothetical protein
MENAFFWGEGWCFLLVSDYIPSGVVTPAVISPQVSGTFAILVEFLS